MDREALAYHRTMRRIARETKAMDEKAAELEWSVHAEQVRLKQERDEARAEAKRLSEINEALWSDLAEETKRVDEARALLRECHRAIWKAIGSEDGLDGSEGEPVVRRIEAMMRDLQLPPDTPAI